MDTPCAITLPSKFDAAFSGSSVAQGQDVAGEPDRQALYDAYRDAYHRRYGSTGYTLTLTLPRAHAASALRVLLDYAEVFEIGARDALGEVWDDRERRELRAELHAIQAVTTATKTLLKQFD